MVSPDCLTGSNCESYRVGLPALANSPDQQVWTKCFAVHCFYSWKICRGSDSMTTWERRILQRAWHVSNKNNLVAEMGSWMVIEIPIFVCDFQKYPVRRSSLHSTQVAELQSSLCYRFSEPSSCDPLTSEDQAAFGRTFQMDLLQSYMAFGPISYIHCI